MKLSKVSYSEVRSYKGDRGEWNNIGIGMEMSVDEHDSHDRALDILKAAVQVRLDKELKQDTIKKKEIQRILNEAQKALDEWKAKAGLQEDII
jgi:hypothetical protein